MQPPPREDINAEAHFDEIEDVNATGAKSNEQGGLRK
jgi:hypothetical protein